MPRPERVAGRAILVVDDVYSEGYSLREMARALRLAGAADVGAVVLTRRKGWVAPQGSGLAVGPAALRS